MKARAARHLIAATAAVIAWGALAPEASAQGFTPQEGSVWVKTGYIYSRAEQNFAGLDEILFDGSRERGQRVPFRSRNGQIVGGQMYTHEATLDAVWAPVDRIVVGLFAPVFRFSHYSNTTNNYTTENAGVGDVQLYGGYQLTSRSNDRVGSTVMARVKIPGSYKFPYTNEALLGEGQFDLSAVWANTVAIRPRLHLNASAEFRYRFGWVGNSPDGRFADPGEEVHISAGLAGGPTEWLWLSVGYTGMWGTPWRIRRPDFGFDEIDTRVERRFHAGIASAYLMLGQYIGVDGLALDVFGKIPLAGQDHAVMYSGGAGVAYGF